MIHFCFTVSSTDAESIMQCVQDSITKANTECSRALALGRPDRYNAYNKQVTYLTELKGKMSNAQVIDVGTED
jgi:hypothetical protein